jgi:hypothetical protein
MGVVSCEEVYRGIGMQVEFGDTPIYTRVFLVRTNEHIVPTGTVTFDDISGAPGVAWLDPHPENEDALCISADCQLDGESPFHWKVTYKYKSAVDLTTLPWERPAQYTFSGSLTSAPAFWHYPVDNDNSTRAIIVNTAGDALSGLDRDEGEFTVTITQNFQPPFDYPKAQLYVGAINSDTWSGSNPKTWKCTSITGNRKLEQVAGEMYVYWEVNASLAYRATGWDISTWDVGFNFIQDGTGTWNSTTKTVTGGHRMKFKDFEGNPVSEPCALSYGRAKADGQPPDMVTFRVYRMLPFIGTFPLLPS